MSGGLDTAGADFSDYSNPRATSHVARATCAVARYTHGYSYTVFWILRHAVDISKRIKQEPAITKTKTAGKRAPQQSVPPHMSAASCFRNGAQRGRASPARHQYCNKHSVMRAIQSR